MYTWVLTFLGIYINREYKRTCKHLHAKIKNIHIHINRNIFVHTNTHKQIHTYLNTNMKTYIHPYLSVSKIIYMRMNEVHNKQNSGQTKSSKLLIWDAYIKKWAGNPKILLPKTGTQPSECCGHFLWSGGELVVKCWGKADAILIYI